MEDKNLNKPTILKPTNSSFRVKSRYSALVVMSAGGSFQIDGSVPSIGAAAPWSSCPLLLSCKLKAAQLCLKELTGQNLTQEVGCVVAKGFSCVPLFKKETLSLEYKIDPPHLSLGWIELMSVPRPTVGKGDIILMICLGQL